MIELNEKNKKRNLNTLHIKLCDLNKHDDNRKKQNTNIQDVEEDVDFFVSSQKDEIIQNIDSVDEVINDVEVISQEGRLNITSGILMIHSTQFQATLSLRLLSISNSNIPSSLDLINFINDTQNTPYLSFLIHNSNGDTSNKQFFFQPVATLISLHKLCDYCSMILENSNQIASLILFNIGEIDKSIIELVITKCCPTLLNIPFLYSPTKNFLQSNYLSTFQNLSVPINSVNLLTPLSFSYFKSNSLIDELWNDVEKLCIDMKSIPGYLLSLSFLFQINYY